MGGFGLLELTLEVVDSMFNLYAPCVIDNNDLIDHVLKLLKR